MKRTITLDIAGTKFRLISDAEPFHLEGLASTINERVERLSRSAKSASAAQVLALVALDLADELKTTERKLQEVEQLTRSTIQGAIARIDQHLREQ